VNVRLHRYAVFVALCTLIPVITGAAVTSTKGLPGASLFSSQAPAWIATGHSVAAYAVGLLVAGLFIWLTVRKASGLLRLISGICLVFCIAEGLLGVRAADVRDPNLSSVLHAALAQLLFTGTVLVAVFTSQAWEGPRNGEIGASRSSLRSIAPLMPALVLLQALLGATYRHGASGVMLHILNAMIVTLVIFVAGMLVTRQSPESSSLRRTAVAVMAITGSQVALGFAAFILLLIFSENNLSLEVISVAHVATGGLTLAAVSVLALQIRREMGAALPSAEQGPLVGKKPDMNQLSS